MSDSTPLRLQFWLAQLIVSTLFASGFVVYYRELWHLAFTDQNGKTRRAIIIRIAMLAITMILGLGFYQITRIIGNPTLSLVFANFSFFVMTFPLLDEKSNWLEYTLRAIGVYEMWLLLYWSAFGTWRFALTFVLITITLIGMRKLAAHIRYHISRHVFAFTYLAAIFWCFKPAIPGGLTALTPVFLGLVTFFVMALVTAIYLKYDHSERLVNAANDQQAHYDALTNSKNYAAYVQDVTGIFARAKEQHTPVAMAVLDIDHFKQINDHYGHLAGDQVLAGVAESLENMLSEYPGVHTLYRTGGEEFNVVFPGRTAKDVQAMLLECWRVVRETRFPAAGYEVLVTISIGIAQLSDNDEKFDDLYARADASLYQSKHYGRDVVTVMGKTLNVVRKPKVISTVAIFNQKIINVHKVPHVAVHNEVRLARYDSDRDQWMFPKNFELAVGVQIDFAKKAIQSAEVPKIMLNLTQEQFALPEVLQKLVDFRDHCDALQVLVVELMGMPEASVMQRMGRLYREADVRIEVENLDIATDLFSLAPVLPFMDGVKFELADLCREYPGDALIARLKEWHAVLDPLNIDIVITGIENSNDADYAEHKLHAHFLQGYFYDRPALPRIE
ncbi:bifunctional diguanylate cyclase/phosphodiesterase [Lacticaseibacillus hulanensis]|uniref:bifunctional diguanylate cyclase/phosphodiesterase n=1 Tax=Lacticaseibacillus hulanensis TaxID=2493111 RepID=UPI000FD9EF5D|nr:diguanylate cyclase [Lacticaseibacillus hulanensis]